MVLLALMVVMQEMTLEAAPVVLVEVEPEERVVVVTVEQFGFATLPRPTSPEQSPHRLGQTQPWMDQLEAVLPPVTLAM
jgi:hypothetical protein